MTDGTPKSSGGWPDEATMALCAIRYTLGRSSYIVADGIRWARKYGAKFPAVRRVVIADIENAIRDRERSPVFLPMLGDAIDEREWRKVLSELKTLDKACSS